MKIIRAALFSSTVMLTVGAFAQYPAGGQTTPSQGSMQPSQTQTQPAQNPGTMQPGQSSQPQQPGMQPSQQPQSSQQTHGASIDDQVKSLTEQLSLTPGQQAKVKTALEDQHTQAMTIIQDNAMAREDKIQKIHALRESTIAKVRTALTSDDQKKKFDQMVQAQDERMHQQPQAPPQPK